MIERRKHKRFEVKQKTFALIRSGPATINQINKMHMGEIAFAILRSNPTRLGPIKNISRGGLAFRYVAGREQSSRGLKLDILIADCGFYLGSLNFKIIFGYEVVEEPPCSPFKMRHLSLQFRDLTPGQISQLDFFIENYSLGD